MSKPTAWYRRLVALAELKGDITQRDIAQRLGVSDAAVSLWKNGRPPKWESVIAAAEAYDFDPLELMRIA
jgi:transcriptional regulator with XRE-family HTH domain